MPSKKPVIWRKASAVAILSVVDGRVIQVEIKPRPDPTEGCRALVLYVSAVAEGHGPGEIGGERDLRTHPLSLVANEWGVAGEKRWRRRRSCEIEL